MKSTPRTLAAVVAGVAAAMGAAAAPAAAVGTVPVPVPLEAAEKNLDMELPSLSGEIPLPRPGKPDGPQFVEGRLLPARTIPQVPLTGGLPGAGLRAPVPHVLGDDFDHIGVGVPAADLRTLAPGLSVDAPLTRPNPDHMGLPDTKLPQAGILAPALQTVPGADLAMGPGL
ncbi:hypothetical protein ACIRP7_01450 [Streptomyces sp. NPDC102270]|uniref:hypothetical protein n=1 Tax=Streptomyces sp. NPDC102270 TaxID=3366150 RepID=UPI0037FB8F25